MEIMKNEPTKNVTLSDACQNYLEYLNTIGQRKSTIKTAKRALDLLIAEMGEEKDIGKILPVHMTKFYRSETVTMQPGKNGLKPRAETSITQIHRIVRMSLGFWQERGWIKKLPLPASESRFAERMIKSGVGHRVCTHVERCSKQPAEVHDEAR